VTDEEMRRAAPEFYPADGRILYDDDARVCVMTRATFEGLHEYSGTIPTGKVIGKRWKQNKTYTDRRAGEPEWFLRGYEELDPPNPEQIAIPWWRIEIVEESHG
jgi:hypothetical protein